MLGRMLQYSCAIVCGEVAVSPEERSVAKILVADDNSNIQKMVGLALKDQGIDVVAVGNGEAAVRKISDVRPDLVLADVFMPVRNGYEVCKYVKDDSSLAHIPVILLVGAFDPLDEQEAQRVGADGVLKKPFIPPDPLISMVKSALQRASAGHASAPAAKPAEAEPFGTKEMPTPSHASMPKVEATPVPEFHLSDNSATANESFVEDLPAPPAGPEPVRIDAGSQPVAFGSLLETPAETTEEDPSFATTTSPEFAMEHDWRDRDEEETEVEEEDEEPAAWRPAGTAEEAEAPAAKATNTNSSISDWRTGGFEQIAASKSRNAGWEPEEEEKPAPVETAPVASSPAPQKPAVPPPPVKEATPIPVAGKPLVADTWAPPSPPPLAPVAPAVLNKRPAAETATAVVEDKAKPASE